MHIVHDLDITRETTGWYAMAEPPHSLNFARFRSNNYQCFLPFCVLLFRSSYRRVNNGTRTLLMNVTSLANAYDIRFVNKLTAIITLIPTERKSIMRRTGIFFIVTLWREIFAGSVRLEFCPPTINPSEKTRKKIKVSNHT